MEYKKTDFKTFLKKAVSSNQKQSEAKIKKMYEWLKKYSKTKNKDFLAIAEILANLKMDTTSLLAGMLATTNRETEQKILEKAGDQELSQVMLEFQRIQGLEKKNHRLTGKTLSRIILATTKDIRSIILKIALMLEKIRHEKPDKKEIQKIKEIYLPISHKLGLYEIEWELRDLCFKNENPKAYYEIKKKLNQKRSEREKKSQQIKKEIQKKLKKAGMEAVVTSRAKSFYSIYKKMQYKKIGMDKVYDKYGARVIVYTVSDCYKALGILQTVFKRKGIFDDYIAQPKKNNYQSIHTVLEIMSEIVEVQIRTWEMNRTAEQGIAAHWRYKNFEGDPYTDSKLSWARQLVEWQRSNTESKEILNTLKIDFEDPNIFVFTPKGDIVTLKKGSTGLDFAFAIHTDIGMKCKTIKINGVVKNLDTVLSNGDTIEVITDKKVRPSRNWLTIAKTQKAISKTKKALGLEPKNSKAKPKRKIVVPQTKKKIKIGGCCNPLPGDTVIGIKTTKRKITIHKTECTQINKIPKKKYVAISWPTKQKNSFKAIIKVVSLDRTGLLTDILKEFAKQNIKIIETKATTQNMVAECQFKVELKNVGQAEKLIRNIEKVLGVKSVVRE